jgi:ubiquinone biosynthesis protein COQ9
VFQHAFDVADEAIVLSTRTDQHTSVCIALLSVTSVISSDSLHFDQDNWYASRVALASIYLSAELHQMTSPSTAPDFLDSLLGASDSLNRTVSEVGLFADYMFKGWKGIFKSGGAF